LSVVTRSTATPWRPKPGACPVEEGNGAGLTLVGQARLAPRADVGGRPGAARAVGEAGGIVDRDVEDLQPLRCRGPLSRCRRRRAIAATTSAGSRRGERAGAELRSWRARSPPCQPLAGAAFRHPGRQRSVPDPPALLAHPRHEKESTMDHHTGILVDVHPELRLKVGGLPNPNLAALLRMNNLHSNNT
jgi:hypothetical protein